jgi:uncharacterized coiled-coil protein SlyX
MGESPGPNPIEDRISSLEELLSFADRRADLLSEQVAELERRLREAVERIRHLEENLGRVGERLAAAPTTAEPTQRPGSSAVDAW